MAYLPLDTTTGAGDTAQAGGNKINTMFSEVYGLLNKVSPILGPVADINRFNTNASASNTKSMSLAERTAMSPIANPRLRHLNGYVNASYAEVPGSAAMTVTTWIEYPINVTMSAGVTTTVAPGVWADTVHAVAIPKGERFRVWTRRDGPLMPFATRADSAAIDMIVFGDPAPTTPTLGNVLTGASQGNGYCPIVLDMTSDRTLLSIEDSHGHGAGDVADGGNRFGMVERFVGDRVAHIMVGVQGDSLASFLQSGNNAMRVALGAMVTDVNIGLAGNDISAGRTAAAIIADIKTVAAMFPNKILCTCTEVPKTTSTDGWTTVANQTVTANEQRRVDVNAFKRSSGGLFRYVHDMERMVSNVKNFTSIVWDVDRPNYALTDDGIHHNRSGYKRCETSSAPRVPTI